jgi:hypothetical protein
MMDRMKKSSFISKLGSADEVAAALAKMSGENVTAHAISNWPIRGIPRYLRPYAVRLAEQKGVALPKELRRFASSNQVPA